MLSSTTYLRGLAKESCCMDWPKDVVLELETFRKVLRKGICLNFFVMEVQKKYSF